MVLKNNEVMGLLWVTGRMRSLIAVRRKSGQGKRSYGQEEKETPVSWQPAGGAKELEAIVVIFQRGEPSPGDCDQYPLFAD